MIKSKLLWHGPFLELVLNYRVLHLEGRYGGGKTALSHMLAYEMVNMNRMRYLVSNVPSVWRQPLADVYPPDSDSIQIDSVVVLDEGGMFLRTQSEADKYLAFLRKLNVVIIVPSVDDPPKNLRSLRVQRTMDLTKLGLPVWVYRWRIYSGDVKDQGHFLWLFPSGIYGIYSTDAMPISGSGLDDWLADWTAKAQKALDDEYTDPRFVYQKGQIYAAASSDTRAVFENAGRATVANSEVAVSGRGDVAAMEAVAGRFEEAADKILEAVSSTGGNGKRWRRR